ncbi:NaeI family type II restriction endonuclease [Kitasatospora sp. NPDC028055]|uniref:NaeI family type II restriction endonuclease n=1 Tax=Kitasatospora sp. NPDC028055 TaxID=3155653 RepID=UPI0033FD8061
MTASLTVPSPASHEDPGLDEVVAWFTSQPDLQKRFGSVIRQAVDEVLDGRRTGRYDITGVDQPVKTFLGTKVEIITRFEFDLGYGDLMDYTIAGHPVDAKFTLNRFEWQIPHHAMGHICLLINADDKAGTFAVGLVRVTPELLRTRGNQDKKRVIAAGQRSAIRWLVQNGTLPENQLLALAKADGPAVDEILRGKSGQDRINALMRRFAGRIVLGTTVDTVACQRDSSKRVRDSRKDLAKDGIVVLSGDRRAQRAIAEALGLPVPQRSSWLPVRLAPSLGDGRPAAAINGSEYTVWQTGDAQAIAPELPDK